MITYSQQLYAFCEPVLGLFERRGTPREPSDAQVHSGRSFDVLIFGVGRFGSAIGQRLQRQGLTALGIDFNPAAVRRWRALGLEAEFGEATDAEFLASLPLRNVRWAVSTIPVHLTSVTHDDTRRAIVQGLRAAGFAGRIAVTSHRDADAEMLIAAGADLVLEPFQDAADRAIELLLSGHDPHRIESVEDDESV